MADVKKLTIDDLKQIKGSRADLAASVRVEDSEGNRGEAGN